MTFPSVRESSLSKSTNMRSLNLRSIPIPLSRTNFIFFFNDTATTEIYTVSDTLSLHDALPIYRAPAVAVGHLLVVQGAQDLRGRSEEHTSELQSPDTISYAVFCLKKKKQPHVNSANRHHRDRHDTEESMHRVTPDSYCFPLGDPSSFKAISRFFFFNDTATTEIYTVSDTLSLHDALPISNPSPATPRMGSLPNAF